MLREVVGLYFSPSQKTAEITRRITEEIAFTLNKQSAIEITSSCVDLLKHPVINDRYFDEETVLVIGVPVHIGRVPLPCIKLIQKLHGHETMTVAIVSYGNSTYGDSLYELYTFMEDQQFKVISAGAFIVKNSLASKVADGRPDDSDRTKIRDFAQASALKINRLSGSLIAGLKINPAPLDIKGCMPNKAPLQLPLHPIANKNCIGCGACARICPTGAISIDDPKKVNSKKCISCTACMQVCEHNARGMFGPMAEASRLALEVMYRKRKEPEWFI